MPLEYYHSYSKRAEGFEVAPPRNWKDNSLAENSKCNNKKSSEVYLMCFL
jgi:hypothetical protein